jgi:hypothetical protein
LEGASVAIVCWQLMALTVTKPMAMVTIMTDGDEFSYDDGGDDV